MPFLVESLFCGTAHFLSFCLVTLFFVLKLLMQRHRYFSSWIISFPSSSFIWFDFNILYRITFFPLSAFAYPAPFELSQHLRMFRNDDLSALVFICWGCFCTTAVDISVWKEAWGASYRLPGGAQLVSEADASMMACLGLPWHYSWLLLAAYTSPQLLGAEGGFPSMPGKAWTTRSLTLVAENV